MDCPKCGMPMQYIQQGWHWDGTPSMAWRCAANYPCWYVIFDGDPPWENKLPTGYFLAYLEEFGHAPITGTKPPKGFTFQMRLI